MVFHWVLCLDQYYFNTLYSLLLGIMKQVSLNYYSLKKIAASICSNLFAFVTLFWDLSCPKSSQ